MKKRTAVAAETLCRRDILQRIYQRQFLELAPLRRHIFSLLPLNRTVTVFEPGCGTGLLGRELLTLTGASYTGMDIREDILPEGNEFVAGDALKSPPRADLYVSSFFFSSVKCPERWLKRVRKQLSGQGLFAVFAEYDYNSIVERQETGMADRIRVALGEQGLFTGHGGNLDTLFEKAGFIKLYGGEAESSFHQPDREFMAAHIQKMPETLSDMIWRIVWGVWKRKPGINE